MSGAGEAAVEQTDVGSYFVANYPPFSVWSADRPSAESERPALDDVRRRRPAPWSLPAHPLLPKALPFLLLQGLYRQECARGRAVSRSAGARMGALRSEAGSCGTPIQLRLLRRRHAVVPVDEAAAGTGRQAQCERRVEPRRRDHLRMRARHDHGSQARGDPRAGRHAPQPRRRELRRSRPRAERPRASIAGNRPLLRSGARAQLPADQHRPDRRHAR